MTDSWTGMISQFDFGIQLGSEQLHTDLCLETASKGGKHRVHEIRDSKASVVSLQYDSVKEKEGLYS